MSHNNTTHNPNNLYSVDIVSDVNVDDLNNSVVQFTPSGVPFYKMTITPNNNTDLVIAGNFKIDDIISSWEWNSNLPNGSGQFNCFPPKPPYYGTDAGQSLKNTIARPYVLSGQGQYGLCWGAGTPTGSNFIGNGYYRFQGPYVFDNSDYCDGEFIDSNKSVTWRKIYLIDIYEMSSGMFANDNLSPAVEESVLKWITASYFNSQFANVLHNGYPSRLNAFVFPEYHPTNKKTADMTVDLDFDMLIPKLGCLDQGSSAYDSTAEISDPTACVYPPPRYNVTVSANPASSTGEYTDVINNIIGLLGGRNFLFNSDNSAIALANDYAPGEEVTETVVVDLTPHPHPTITNFETVYDFAIPGGPDPNITQTNGFQNQGEQWGNAKNNLTSASIRILNVDGGNNPFPIYNVEDDEGGVPGGLSLWHNSPDPTGLQPSREVFFNDNIDTLDPTGATFVAETAIIKLKEYYYFSSDEELIINPGYEWFPYKLQLTIELDFVMPDHDVNIDLQIDHDTINQGDPNWVNPRGF